MVRVAKQADGIFIVTLDAKMKDKLSGISDWASSEATLQAIITDALREWPFPVGYCDDLYGDEPF